MIVQIRSERNLSCLGENPRKALPTGMRRLAHPWNRLERGVPAALHFRGLSPEVAHYQGENITMSMPPDWRACLEALPGLPCPE